MKRVILLSLAALACSIEPPYDRTNPFDPGSPYEMRLVGVPDTVSSIGQRFQATIDRDPPVNAAELAIQWEIVDPNDALVSVVELQHVFRGEFLATSAMSSRLRTVAIGARFNGDVVVGRSIVVGQLVDTLNLSCGSPAVPVACTAVPLAVGGSIQILSNARDARGNAVQSEQFAMQRALVTFRTSGVLSSAVTPNAAGTYSFAATGAGSTWIIIRSDRAVDSVQVTVTP